MVVRILLALLMIVLASGFIFFAGNIIWLGAREFFKVYGPKSAHSKRKTNTKEAEDGTNTR